MREISTDILRILDANINRAGEGLRVLEEFARLSLDDVAITQQLKNMRHRVVMTGPDLQKKLLAARDAAGDVGSAMDVPGEAKTGEVSETIIANARRVQESLRVMEELAKNPATGLDKEEYRKVRFELYTLEKELLGKITRKDIVKKITGLYVIIDTEWLKGRRAPDIAAQAIRGGANVIQLRCKDGGTRVFLSNALELKKVCSEKGVPFIVNDSLEIALASEADGLHLGKEDLPVETARKLMPVGMLLGVSVGTEEDAGKALEEGADYLGVGAVYDTATKEYKTIGLSRLKNIRKKVGLPVVAIGGINSDNIGAVMEAGADAAAVISAVMGAEDAENAARQLANIIRGEK